MKKILSTLVLLTLTACSTGAFPQTSSTLYKLETNGGFSDEDKEAFAKQASTKEIEMLAMESWNDNDVVELARYYDYSGHMGRAILLYKEYEARLVAQEQEMGEAVMRNIAVAYSRIQDYKNALQQFGKYYEKYGRKSTLKEMSEIYTAMGNTEKAAEYRAQYDAFVEPAEVETN